MMQNVSFDPMNVGVLCASAVVAPSDFVPHLVEQFRFLIWKSDEVPHLLHALWPSVHILEGCLPEGMRRSKIHSLLEDALKLPGGT